MHLIFLIISSFMYVMPFYFNSYAWVFVFFFAIPLFYSAFTTQLSFKEGYLWGFTTFLLHMFGVLWSIACMSSTPFLFCVLPFLLCVVYQGLYAGLWFFMMHRIQRIVCMQQGSLLQALLWIFGMWLYFYWIEHYCFICFDYWEGYIFMSPLIPLVHTSQLFGIIHIVGKEIMALLLYSWSAFCALFLIHQHKWYLFFALIIIGFWLISCVQFYSSTYVDKPSWISHIISFPKFVDCTIQPNMCAQTLAEEIRQLLIRFPEVEIILMPESCLLDGAIVATYAYYFSQQYVGKPIHILLGSFYEDKENYYNVCYWLYDGVIQARYNKRHTMPLTERIPFLFHYQCIKNLYFAGTTQVTRSENKKAYFQCLKNSTWVPYICSELFFNTWPEDTTHNPLIVLVNDRWCPVLYMRYLMVQVARFKALLWQRDIIYISYFFALVCTSDGHCYEIQKAF